MFLFFSISEWILNCNFKIIGQVVSERSSAFRQDRESERIKNDDLLDFLIISSAISMADASAVKMEAGGGRFCICVWSGG